MLTDTALRNWKLKSLTYKASDRDGMYVTVSPTGTVTFRYDYRLNGRRETLTIGRYGPAGISLEMAREKLIDAKKAVAQGKSPALEKQREKRRLAAAKTFGDVTEKWLAGARMDEAMVRRFIERLRTHARRAPQLVELSVEPDVRQGPQGPHLLKLLREAVGRPHAGWDDVIRILAPASDHPPPLDAPEPLCLPLLREALALRDASLVIYRERTLVEFQIEKLDGIHRYEEQGHVSWQIGGLRDHHCHLALGAVSRVLFSAEPVSCQGGGLNYTIWFLTAGPSGNPWRRDGYFSVVLNRPYTGDAARPEVIRPVLDMYGRHRQEPWVQADIQFMKVLEQGPPSRRQQPATASGSSWCPG